MAFLTDLDKKLSRFGQDALKKTRDVSESVRVSGVIKEEEAKQVELYKLIGEYFYKNYAAVAEEPMKVWCDEVTRSKEAVAQYQEQIRIMKGLTNCPHCHAEIGIDAMFCNNCGTRVNVPEPQPQVPPVSGKVCPSCGVPINDVQLFCTNCGSKIPQRQPAPVQPEMNYAPIQPEMNYSPVQPEMNYEPVQQEMNYAPVQPEANYAPEYEFSMSEPVSEPSAEYEQPASEGFFVQPELSFGGGSQPAMDEAAAAQEPERYVCSNCGEPLSEGQVFCTNCGMRL